MSRKKKGTLSKEQRIIKKAAKAAGIKAKILDGLWATETGRSKTGSTSSAGAVGPFQFLPSTARARGIDPMNFKEAAFGAADYLADYKDRGTAGMLSAYVAGGAGGNQQWYVDRVLDAAKDWKGGSIGKGGGMKDPGKAPGLKLEKGTEPKFDEAGYQEALGKQLVAKVLAKKPDSPLLKLGLYSTADPDKSEFVTPGTPSKLKQTKGEAPKGMKQGMKGAGQATGDAIDPGKWGGSGPVARKMLAKLDLAGLVSNTKNPRGLTPSGNVSDHDSEDPDAANAYAADISATGKQGLAISKKVAKYYGMPVSNGEWVNKVINTKKGRFRVQLGWNVPDHYDHVHVGIKRV